MALAATALVSIWVAFLSGEEVDEHNTYGGPLEELVEEHEERADVLRISVTAFALASFAAAWWHTRTGAARIVLGVAVTLLGALTLVYVLLTGDAGAQIAWYGING